VCILCIVYVYSANDWYVCIVQMIQGATLKKDGTIKVLHSREMVQSRRMVESSNMCVECVCMCACDESSKMCVECTVCRV